LALYDPGKLHKSRSAQFDEGSRHEIYCPACRTRAVVELREPEIDVLVQKGVLQADARNDANAVRKALYRYFDSTLK
jgi:hypothetical protein